MLPRCFVLGRIGLFQNVIQIPGCNTFGDPYQNLDFGWLKNVRASRPQMTGANTMSDLA